MYVVYWSEQVHGTSVWIPKSAEFCHHDMSVALTESEKLRKRARAGEHTRCIALVGEHPDSVGMMGVIS